MKHLDTDPDVEAWTKRHGIRIPYVTAKGHRRVYVPDFLVRKLDGKVHLDEVKGGHLLDHPDTQAKFEGAKKWCAQRGMAFNVITKE